MKTKLMWMFFILTTFTPLPSLAEKFALPDALYDEFERQGLSMDEVDNSSIQDGTLVVIFDDEKLSIKRALKTIKIICEFVKGRPDDFLDTPFSDITIVNFIQSAEVTLKRGRKRCQNTLSSAESSKLINEVDIRGINNDH